MITKCYSTSGCPCLECEKECCIESGEFTDTEKLCDKARMHCEECSKQHRLQELQKSFERIARATSGMGGIIKHNAFATVGVRELQKYAKMQEAENRLAAVAGSEYVESIRPVLIKLAYSRAEPGTELYISYLNEITMLIMSGMEPSDVLSSYEAKLAKMEGRKV